jgi:hypothetical protein
VFYCIQSPGIGRTVVERTDRMEAAVGRKEWMKQGRRIRKDGDEEEKEQ